MCFNVNFRLLKTIYVHLLVCYLNKQDIISVVYPNLKKKRKKFPSHKHKTRKVDT